MDSAWTAITIRLLDSTDYKTASRVFGPLENYIVSLQTKESNERPTVTRDVQILEVGVDENDVGGSATDNREGFRVRPTDDNGTFCGPEEFVAYEDVEAIGVY